MMYLLIHIIGIIPTYFITRWAWMKFDNSTEWTMGSRMFTVILSVLFSWVFSLASIISLGIQQIMGNEKPASW